MERNEALCKAASRVLISSCFYIPGTSIAFLCVCGEGRGREGK